MHNTIFKASGTFLVNNMLVNPQFFMLELQCLQWPLLTPPHLLPQHPRILFKSFFFLVIHLEKAFDSNRFWLWCTRMQYVWFYTQLTQSTKAIAMAVFYCCCRGPLGEPTPNGEKKPDDYIVTLQAHCESIRIEVRMTSELCYSRRNVIRVQFSGQHKFMCANDGTGIVCAASGCLRGSKSTVSWGRGVRGGSKRWNGPSKCIWVCFLFFVLSLLPISVAFPVQSVQFSFKLIWAI